jgi:hypothetical protein
MKQVDIRFNTFYPNFSKFEWRVLVDGEEILVNEVLCNIPTYSTTSFIEGIGKKWHISAKANDVVLSFESEIKTAHII